MSRTLPTATALALISTGALVFASGCGSASSSNASANPAPATTSVAAKKEAPAPATTGGVTLKVTSPASGNLQFEPKTLSAKAGNVTIDYTNPSPVPHNLAILDASGKEVSTEMEQFTNGNKSTSAKLAAGTYKYICQVPGHQQAGMVGDLKVS